MKVKIRAAEGDEQSFFWRGSEVLEIGGANLRLIERIGLEEGSDEFLTRGLGWVFRVVVFLRAIGTKIGNWGSGSWVISMGGRGVVGVSDWSPT